MASSRVRIFAPRVLNSKLSPLYTVLQRYTFEQPPTYFSYSSVHWTSTKFDSCQKLALSLSLPACVYTHLLSLGYFLLLFVCRYNGFKHIKVFQHNGKYGFSVPCSHKSLMELVLHFSEHSLVQHNPGLHTTLQFPVDDKN